MSVAVFELLDRAAHSEARAERLLLAVDLSKGPRACVALNVAEAIAPAISAIDCWPLEPDVAVPGLLSLVGIAAAARQHFLCCVRMYGPSCPTRQTRLIVEVQVVVLKCRGT